MNAKKPTLREQVAAAKDRVVNLGKPKPEDPSQESHPRSSAQVCAASANLGGQLVVCELKPLHAGRHQAGARSWRPRSGDAEGLGIGEADVA